MKNTTFFILFVFLFFKSPSLFAVNENQELIKIKQELKDLSDIRYKNLIELKKEQRAINRRINRLQYSLKFRTDSIFNLISEAELNSDNPVSENLSEKNIKKSINEELNNFKKELKAEIIKTNTQKSSFVSKNLWHIIFIVTILILTLSLFALLYKKHNENIYNLNATLKTKEEEINKIKSDIQNESKQLNRSINNNRTLTHQNIKDIGNKLKEEKRFLQEFIINSNIESLELKCKLLSMELKVHENPEDHILAINIGNDLHKSKEKTEGYDDDFRRVESKYSSCGYELINEFGKDFKDNKDLDIEWQEDSKLNKGEYLVKYITKPIILFKKHTIQKGLITAIKPA